MKITIRLRECMDDFEARTGEHVTYPDLAAATGLSEETIQSIATRSNYNATLRVLERLCAALRCSPVELLDWPGREMGS